MIFLHLLKMNHLAHLYLSANSEKILVGNFIADAVKGKKIFNYEQDIQLGILIHRTIDSYTDGHDLVNQGKARLRSLLGKYAGVAIDVFYDYYLSLYWSNYSNIGKQDFIRSAYRCLISMVRLMPGEIQALLPFFVINNWLGKYESIEGLNLVFKGMAKHTSMPVVGEKATNIMLEHHFEYEQEFNIFFVDLIQYLEIKFDAQFNLKSKLKP